MILSRFLDTGFLSSLVILIVMFAIASCSAEGNSFDNSIFEELNVDDTATGGDLVFDRANFLLSWSVPVEREDRSPLSLSEIAGYSIYYGPRQGDYLNTIDINDGAAVSYTMSDLPVGTYYIVLTVRDTEGRESRYSNELLVNL